MVPLFDLVKKKEKREKKRKKSKYIKHLSLKVEVLPLRLKHQEF